MKKIILLFFAAHIFYCAGAQNTNYSIVLDKNIIIDTVTNLRSNKYYLTNITSLKSIDYQPIKKISNDWIVIRAITDNQVDSNQKFYLIDDEWKLSKRLSNATIGNSKAELFSIKIMDANLANEAMDFPNAEIIRKLESSHIWIIKTTLANIKSEIIKNKSVVFVDLITPSAKEESPLRVYNPDINRINKAKYNYPLLTGDGLIVSVKENSIDEEDLDLLGKITRDENSSLMLTQHAKEMGTLIAGEGNSHRTGKGIAEGVNIYCTDFASLFAENEDYYSAHSITIQNHSYGTGIENFYGNETISYDQLAINNPTLVHVFSAGNAGSLAPEFGTYAGIEGYANITGDFKQAKNVMVIAALDSTLMHESLTSSGPAYDGRIKPELAAFGGEGSSESAALASGSIALLQDKYKSETGLLPSSSLIKSLLIASANEAHTKGIDFRTGYGSINLNKCLQLIEQGNYIEGSVGANDHQSYFIKVPPGTAEIKVAVSWIDPPANPEDATALVNDLNLLMKMPDNSTVLPWVLDPSPNSSSLSALPTRAEDHLNNVEMISVESPVEGTYEVLISSGQLQGATQNFSIAYNVKPKDQFEWSFPLAADKLEANTTPYFRWENSYLSQTGDLSIKYGNENWQVLGQVSLEDEYYKYAIIDTTVTAQLKMEINGANYLSNTFSITKPIKLMVENDCQDEFIVSWNKLDNINGYLLNELQGEKLVQVLSTADTFAILPKSIYDGSYFSVQPIFNNGVVGANSFTINVPGQNKGCYLENFLVLLDINNEGQIDLKVNVPTEIEEITIYKEYQKQTTIFQQFNPGEQSAFQFIDNSLLPGTYFYSTSIELGNGTKYLSDTLTLFYTDNETVIAFPNPVYENIINILNNYPGGVLQLLNAKGQVIKAFDLVNVVEPIDLTGLEKGMYIFRIYYNDNIVNSGKIIKL